MLYFSILYLLFFKRRKLEIFYNVVLKVWGYVGVFLVVLMLLEIFIIWKLIYVLEDVLGLMIDN